MVSEYRAIWSVPGGGTGYSTFHASDITIPADAQAFANAVKAFVSGVAPAVPDDVTFTFDPEVRGLDTITGALTAVYPVTAPTSVAGGSAATYAAGAGGRVDWLTSAIVAGRRLRGRTYVVPLTSFQADGTLGTLGIDSLEDGATDYLAAMAPLTAEPVVWHRPVSGAGGSTSVITAFSVPDKSALLRSRRD